MRRSLCYLCLAFTLILISCGGGGSGPEQPAVTKISGKVVDGYVSGAKVCLDKNKNGKCDPDEPSTTSQSDGSYELSVSTEDAQNYPVVAEVPANATGNEAGKSVTLITPPGKYRVVSPLTSLVFAEAKRNPGKSYDEVESQLRSKLGVDVALFEDYLSDSSEDYQTLSKVARVVIKLVADFIDQIENQLGISVSDEERDELLAVVFGIVVDKIEDIKALVDTGSDDNAIVDKIKNNTQIDKDAVLADIEQIASLDNAKQINLTDVEGASMYRFIWQTIRHVKFNHSNEQLESAYAHLKDVSALSDVISKAYEIKILVYQKNADGTVSIQDPPYTKKITKVIEVDLSGRQADTCAFIKFSSPDMCTTITFPQGSKVYILYGYIEPKDLNNSDDILSVAKTIDNYNARRPFGATYSDWESFINSLAYGSPSYFSENGIYNVQFKPRDNNQPLDGGDIVRKEDGYDLGDYWFVSDPETGEQFLVVNTVVRTSVYRLVSSRVHGRSIITSQKEFKWTFLNDTAAETILSAVNQKAKYLPDGAMYPQKGYDSVLSIFQSFNSSVSLIGSVNYSCSFGYTEGNPYNSISIGSCQDKTSYNFEVIPSEKVEVFLFTPPDTFFFAYRIVYADADTFCLTPEDNAPPGEFCVTSANQPTATDLQNFFSSGKKFGLFKKGGYRVDWKIKYCLSIQDDNGNLTFTGYRYSTGGQVSGRISISDGKASFIKESDSDDPNFDPNQTIRFFVDAIIKIGTNTDTGYAIGYDPDTKDKNIAILVETTSCP